MKLKLAKFTGIGSYGNIVTVMFSVFGVIVSLVQMGGKLLVFFLMGSGQFVILLIYCISMYSSVGSSAALLQLQPEHKEENIDELLKGTGYNLVDTREQTIYGGPPSNWMNPPPLKKCRVKLCYQIE